MDFTEIALSRKELRALRASKRKQIPISRTPRLIRLKLTQHVCTGVPGYAPQETGLMEISDFGMDYLAYYRQARKDIWLVNAKIPILVSIATNLVIAGIRQMWPSILQWVSSVCAGSLS